MTPDALATLAFQAVLVLARVGAAVILLPGLGEPDVPARIRLALVLALVAVLLPVLLPSLPPMPEAPTALLALIATETVIGLWLGMLARLVALALTQAGQVAALMIGLASPLQTDAMLGAAGTATARAFGLLAAVLVLSTGLYALPLRALAGSYAAMPPGAPLRLGASTEALAQMVTDSVALALRLAAPLVAAALLGNLALALLARFAPQVQIFLVALPAQILGGLLLLAVALPALVASWSEAARVLLPAPFSP